MKKTKTKIKGSVLAFTTFVLIAITIIISTIFLQAGIITYYQANVIVESNVITDINIGINYVLYSLNSNQNSDVDLVDLLNDPLNPVITHSSRWGFLQIVGAKKRTAKRTIEKNGFVGFKNTTENNYSLYLVDAGSPLSLCGSTRIKGNAYLPLQGVKKGYLGNNPYNGDKLVYGNILKSNSTMPDVFRNTIDSINNYFNISLISMPKVFISIGDADNNFFNSFNNHTKIIYDESPIHLSNFICRGNYLIESVTSVSLDSTVKIEDVIIKAPYIEILEGFKGTVQCIASDSIFIDKNCHLIYPSVLSIIVQPQSDGFKSMVISDSSTIEGLLFVAATNQTKETTLLTLKGGATIIGQVFCNGLFEAKGKVIGNTVCRRTILFTPSSVHNNHLLNAKFITNTNNHFLNILPGIINKGRKDIIKWI
ncbi:MAG: hypothetical protein QM503_03160 [Bacteroidota bacterium]